MSLVAMPAPDPRPDPPNSYPRPSSDDSLKLGLGTNNPFRRPSPPTDQHLSPVRRVTPPFADRERPMSRNPFLDPPAAGSAAPKTEQDAVTAKLVDDIFGDPSSPERSQRNGPPLRNAPSAPRPGALAPPYHRPSRSGDARDGSRPTRPHPDGERRGPFSPEKQRARRNSESSLMDKDKADEDRRRRERRREREARREREGKDGKDSKEKDSKDGKSRSSKPIRRPQGFDVIDKLDLTGIYGSGFIHHDGPFDACNPHRNKKTNHRAPMQAFHPNSANNALGGGNPPRQFDHDKFHGRGVEGFADYASVGQDYYTTDPEKRDKHHQDKVAQYINPTDRGQQIHGEESHGLGTSTFLEGAPASRAAQARRESENEMAPMNGNPGGLGRTKSLAMRIRGLSQPRRPGDPIAGRVNSPDGYGPKSPDSPPGHTQSAGGPLRARPIAQEKNPFFEREQSNYNDAYQKKGARIEIAEPSNSRGATSNTPRAPALTRALTTDSAPTSNPYDKKDQPSGFISRMKSLKGGKRPRPEIKGQ